MNWICIFYLMCTIIVPYALQSEQTEQKTSLEKVSQLIADQTQFAFSLYPELDASDNNLVFSPYSVSSCLSMVYLGARDVTEMQMQQALELNFSAKEIAAPYADLNQSLQPAANKKNYELKVANALWLDDRSYVLADYRFAIEKQFDAKIGNLSFLQPDAALRTINQWVADKTNGHIQNLLTRNDITASTRLILTNAAYFKGSFSTAFDAKMTHDEQFHPDAKPFQIVKMMEQTAFFPYVENELFQALALPFNGTSKGKGQLALLLLLPKSSENFEAMLEMMPSALTESVADLLGKKVHVQLPRFTLSKRYALNEPLMKLGMNNPFTTQANFSGIDGLLNLYLNTVVHETYFALDENGVTAAAATAASMNLTSSPSEPVEFKADHPFLFFIIDLKSTEVLFMGKFSDAKDLL